MNKKPIQRALIVGATSGIGKETALQLLQKGWILGLAGRREENLKELQQLAPERIHIRAIDICQEDATDRLQELIEEMGGMDLTCTARASATRTTSWHRKSSSAHWRPTAPDLYAW